MLCMCLLMAVGSVTSCCHSRWEAVITQDYFLFPMIHHLISEGNPAFCGFYTSNVTKEKSQQRMSYGPSHETKGAKEFSYSYYGRPVKTWRAEKLLPTELENNTMAALTPPDTAIIHAWGMLGPRDVHDPLYFLTFFVENEQTLLSCDHLVLCTMTSAEKNLNKHCLLLL